MILWDVAVVGGGMAGSAAAQLLAKAGKTVILLEKQRMPHHKVCGEFLSIEAQHYLALLGLNLQALGAVNIQQVNLTLGKHKATCQIPFKACSISRKTLDQELLTRAQAAGAVVKRGYVVNCLQWELTHWKIEISDQAPIQAKTLFLATGKHEAPSFSLRKGKQNQFIGFKMYYRLTLVQMQALQGNVDLHLFKGGYAGLEAVEDGVANLCMVVDKARFNSCKNQWSVFISQLLLEIPLLALRLDQAEPCWAQPLALSGIPYGFVYNDVYPDVQHCYRLGDQMAVIPSFTGDGIAIALYTAFLAVEHYLDTDNPHTYHQQARQVLDPQIQLATQLSRMGYHPVIKPLLFGICKTLPNLMRIFIHLTRLRL
jgi:menaquinone-9 beta-reductase